MRTNRLLATGLVCSIGLTGVAGASVRARATATGTASRAARTQDGAFDHLLSLGIGVSPAEFAIKAESALVTLTPEQLQIARDTIYMHLDDLGLPLEGLGTRIDSVASAAARGDHASELIQEAGDLVRAAGGSVEAADKAMTLLTMYRDFIALGKPLPLVGPDGTQLAAWTAQVVPLGPETPGHEALSARSAEAAPAPQACGSCSAPGGTLAPPTLSCQLAPTTDTCNCSPFSDFYNISLTAGTSYTFTMCPATCAGAAASYDSRIRVYDPSCAVLGDNDDFCGLSSQLTVTPTVTGTHRVEMTGFTSSNCGTHTMGYKQEAPCAGGTCVAPSSTLASPSSSCQCVSQTTTSACNSVFYNVSLTAGEAYQFTMCSATCAGASFGYDTRIRVYSPSCTVLVDNDDSCGLGSEVTITAAVTGTHRVEVTGFVASSFGPSTMCYRHLSGCLSPTVNAVTPTSGGTNATCGTTEVFTANLTAFSSAGTVTFNVTPPAGGSATPGSSVAPYVTFQTDVDSPPIVLTRGTSCGPQDFTVTATAAATCAPTVTSTRTILYTLEDTTPPTVVCPAPAAADCAAIPAPDAALVTSADNCDPDPVESFQSDSIANRTCPGNYTLVRRYQSTDCSGSVGTCTQAIAVTDTTPPTVGANPLQLCLWPPNHKYVCLPASTFAASAADDCSEPITFAVATCSSDQEFCNGQGNTDGDCVIQTDQAGQSVVCMRAERCGTEPGGRTYTLTGTATDACGNTSALFPLATVTVPHDQSEHPECISSNQ